MTEQRTEYDSLWKESLESYFANFIAFFFPQVYSEIGWTRDYEFQGHKTLASTVSGKPVSYW